VQTCITEIEKNEASQSEKAIGYWFTRSGQYPQWVSNIVALPRIGNKILVCVDFKDLNKASLEDDFPLPPIDMLIDNATKKST